MLAPSQTFGDGSQHGESYLWQALVTPELVDAHLYRNGVEIPTPLKAGWDLSEYPEPANYRFTHKVKPYGHTYGPTEVESSWWFRSQRPDHDEALPGFECFGQSAMDPATRKCRVERVIQLAWDLAPATTSDRSGVISRHVRFPLHVYRLTGAPRGSAVEVAVQVSHDSGKTWKRAKVEGGRNGTFTVDIAHERGRTVSLRAQAWDRDGNRIEQTLLDAYQVPSRPKR